MRYGLFISIGVGALWSGLAMAAGNQGIGLKAHTDITNVASLQRGARNYMNYCSGCHSAQYVRYERVAADLDISPQLMEANLIFSDQRLFETIRTALPEKAAISWYGKVPPDLSLSARSRGVDWLYEYLMTFYVSPDSPTGVNNLIFPGAAMPHVLWSLQGEQKAIFDVHVDEAGIEHKTFNHFEPLSAGTLSPEQYDQFVTDLVNYMDYMGEPVKITRTKLGVKVIAFMLFFLILAYALKKEYWKDVK